VSRASNDPGAGAPTVGLGAAVGPELVEGAGVGLELDGGVGAGLELGALGSSAALTFTLVGPTILAPAATPIADATSAGMGTATVVSALLEKADAGLLVQVDACRFFHVEFLPASEEGVWRKS
jgi:hypothetical protein